VQENLIHENSTPFEPKAGQFKMNQYEEKLENAGKKKYTYRKTSIF